MIKGIKRDTTKQNLKYYDELVVPIIDNTAEEEVRFALIDCIALNVHSFINETLYITRIRIIITLLLITIIIMYMYNMNIVGCSFLPYTSYYLR